VLVGAGVGSGVGIGFDLDGRAVEVPDDGASLLEALRDRLGVTSVKDGCSPQGQCGCCTVLVDGQARLACVTPAARVAGRRVVTVDGLPDAARWAEALCATGGSQCGFCTPGIVVRLAAEAARAPGGMPERARVAEALRANACRCTGWQTVLDAGEAVAAAAPARDVAAASRRAAIEGGAPQQVGPHVALGRAGFVDDTAPRDALVAVRSSTDGGWVVAGTLTEARRSAGKVQGRRTTAPLAWPLAPPDGDWTRTLATTWVEPAYLEPDAAWCIPGGEPVTALANGGAFGAKPADALEGLGAVARRLADRHGRAVRVLWSREDVVRLGPKRPPIAAALRADGTGVVRVVRTPGVAERIRAVLPGVEVEELDVAGPPTSVAVRAAGWAEAAVLAASLRPPSAGSCPFDTISTPEGAEAAAGIDADGTVHVRLRCGAWLDAVVVRSYAIGAAHQALGWVRREGVTVDADGEVHDLTIRSFGMLRAAETPPIVVELVADDGPPVRGGDAVFAAVAAAAWRAAGFPPRWPCAR
jgi:xanthine dehydrogenase small subunit